jgi:hypothetical protein
MVSETVGGETFRCALAPPFVSALAVGAGVGAVAEAGPGAVGVGEVGPGEVGVAETGPGAVGVGEAGPGEGVGAAEPEGVAVPELSAVGDGVSA